MADFKLHYAAATGQFEQAVEDIKRTIATAATGGIREAAEFIKTAGRANIASAGFSKKWQNAFRVNVYPSKTISLHPAALAYHKIPYAGIFESGGTISGSPLLWLPLPNVPTKIGGAHMTPANYVRMIGPLHTIYRPGRVPLLAGYIIGGRGAGITISKLKAGARGARGGGGGVRLISVPLFFGLNKVTLAKRFNLQPIFQQAVSQLPGYYQKNLRVS